MKRTKSNARKKSLRKRKPAGQAPSQNQQHVLATAIEHHQQGRLAEAQAGYLSVLKTDPDNADANHLMGVIAYQGGDLETASQLISRAVKIAPQQQQMHSNLGNVLQDQGLPQEAIDCYEKALAINPDFPEGHNNLGNAQKTCGLLEAAVASFQKALALRPDYIEANNNLGNTLTDLGQNTDAISYLRKAISLNPAYADAHYNLALALFGNDQHEEAVASCQQAIALKNDFIEARINLSVFYQKMGRQDDSLVTARDAITIAPEDSSAHTALANVLGKLGLLEEALTSYARAIELDPDNEEAHSNNLMTLHYVPNATTQDLLAAATQWAGPYNEDADEGHFGNSPEPQRRLRIGYVSGDFSSHPVGFYLSQILPFHTAGSVEAICYSNSRKADDVTETLRASVSQWRDVSGLSDADMVAQIKQDGIDILIDLSAHTAGNRLAVFAERPAPVQVTWMGYTGTTGLTSIDYILADRFVVPENEQELFSESVKYLPGSYLCFAPPDFELACVAPPLKQNGHVTFGSFNNRVKITAQTIAAWARILTDVAGSQLLLKTPLLDDESVRRSLLEQFAAHGIDAGRLILEGRAPRADLLKAYQRVDIGLDTQPFGGGVTTAEALWMGVPVVSLCSPRWSGRLGQSIMNAVGLPELIARDGEHYHDLAVSLANDLPRLEQMHASLRDKMLASPFCDGPAFAAKLEQAYRDIWSHWCANTEPTAASDITETYAIAIDHHQNGRSVEAAEAYRKILEIDGNHIASLHNLGVIVGGGGDHQQAVDLFKKAIALNPGYARAYDSMGMALFKMSRIDDALDAFRQSLALDPTAAQVHYNFGTGLKGKGLLDEASASYAEALRLAPGNIDVLNNMAVILLEQDHPTEAAESFRNILAVAPDFAEGHYNLGNACKDMGQLDEALTSYARAIELDPDYDEAHSNLIFLQDLIPTIDQVEQQAERKRWNDKFIVPLSDQIRPHENDNNPERRLRIGYVSADFRGHSASLGFASLIIEHDRESFDVVCYDASPVSDEVSETLRAAATQWRDIKNLGDEELAGIIRDDAIDILVDLSGHTRGNRLKLFGHKPAPVQVTGIGHLSPGISTIDYRLTTQQITPPAEAAIYPEQAIYLNTYFGFSAPPEALPVGPSPCLHNGFITFGFLGRYSKLSHQALTLWAKILLDIPGSRLVLKYSQLDDLSGQTEIKETFAALGITEDRLSLLGKTEHRAHLDAHNRVDIVFDTIPHGGGITTLESLWMGVPVIGLINPDKAGSRIIQSICQPLGLEACATTSLEDYHACALQWAGRFDELALIRQGLRQRVADTYARFPGDVEKSYRLIWQRWCKGEAAAPLYPLS